MTTAILPAPSENTPRCARRLRSAVNLNCPQLLKISEAQSAVHLSPGKWSAREVMGHLIDSASNNHQRFVRAQLQDDLVFPGYQQDSWVKLQKYDSAPWTELVALWNGFNLHLARVMESASEPVRLRTHYRHNFHETAWQTIPVDQPVTLDYFMNDYVDHLEHHLRQILQP